MASAPPDKSNIETPTSMANEPQGREMPRSQRVVHLAHEHVHLEAQGHRVPPRHRHRKPRAVDDSGRDRQVNRALNQLAAAPAQATQSSPDFAAPAARATSTAHGTLDMTTAPSPGSGATT